MYKCSYEGDALAETYTVQILHAGNGNLLWAKVYYTDGTSTEIGEKKSVTSISLSPSTESVTVGEAKALQATITPSDATVKMVKWSVANGNVTLYSDEQCTTEVGTEETKFTTVYAKGITEGSETVTVTCVEDSTKTASCDVTVNVAHTHDFTTPPTAQRSQRPVTARATATLPTVLQ